MCLEQGHMEYKDQYGKACVGGINPVPMALAFGQQGTMPCFYAGR